MQQIKNNLDWDGGGAPEAPSSPENLQQTGLTAGFLNDMILRILYARGGLLGLDLARLLCLPFKVIEESLGFLKNEKAVEVLGGDLIGRISYKYNLTDIGRRRAQEAMKMCRLRRPRPGAAGGLRRTGLPPGGDGHQRLARGDEGGLRPPRH